jgi:glycosyltransferase involved in cell wall biosynthesis
MNKVLHILPNYFPNSGGIETLLAQYFKSQTDNTEFVHAILTCKRKNQSSVERTPGIAYLSEIDISDLQNSQDVLPITLRIISQLRRVVYELQPSIIHVHTIHEMSLYAVKIARELGIPLIFHFHGTVTEEDMRNLKPIVPFLHNILVVSEAVRQSLLPYLSSDIQIEVLVNGVEDLRGERTTKSNNSEETILIAGRIEHEKGFDIAVRSFALILKEIPAIRLVVIGTGSQSQSLKALGKELGIQSSIDFLGDLKNEEVIQKMEQSNIVLVPSRAIEGFGIVAIEAALREVLVIASDVGGLSYTVEDKKSGFLVPAENPVAMAMKAIEILKDPDYFDEMRKYARIRALDLFSMDSFKTSLERYYRKLQTWEKNLD